MICLRHCLRRVFCPPHIHGNSLVCVRFHFDDSSFKGSLRVRGQHTLLQQCYQKTHHHIDFYLVWFSDMVNKRWTQGLIKMYHRGFFQYVPCSPLPNPLSFLQKPKNFSKCSTLFGLGNANLETDLFKRTNARK